MIDLYLGDCRDKMKEMQPKSIDLILTDPPYGIANDTKLTSSKGKIVSTNEAWGDDFVDSWRTINEYSRWLNDIVSDMIPLMKDTASLIMFVDRNYSGLFIVHMQSLGLIPKNKLYFEKLNPLPHFRKNGYRSCIEEAVWFAKSDKFTMNFYAQEDMKQIFKGNIGNKEGGHPTEKYKWMIAPLVINHSNTGDLVFDPFAGSGTVPALCNELNRNCIACELNPKFYKMMEDKLATNYLF